MAQPPQKNQTGLLARFTLKSEEMKNQSVEFDS
jgi:hypothetical protein